MTGIEEIHDIFSIFHDGAIEGWSGNKDLLTLKIGCQYLSERVDKTFDYFFIELMDINSIEFSTWPSLPDKPAEIKTELGDIFKAELEICSASIENENVLVTCNQSNTDHDYAGGILLISARSIKIYDQSKKELSYESLAKICQGYWDDFEKRSP